MPTGRRGITNCGVPPGTHGAVLSQSKLLERLTPLVRPLRWLALCVAAVAVGVIGWLCYCEYRNSQDVPPPTEAELREHLGHATGWIFTNRARVSTENNAMLWLFIREAGRLSGDVQLSGMASEYQTRYAKGTLSQFFFDPSGSEQLASRRIFFTNDWGDYQRLFVYGATCNNSVREDPGVQALLTPSGCDPQLMWLRSPWCRSAFPVPFCDRGSTLDPQRDGRRTGVAMRESQSFRGKQ